MKKLLAVFGLTVLCLVAFEIGCRVFLRLASRTDSAEETVARRDPRAGMPAYAGADYDVDRLLEEDEALNKSVYRPFVVWSRKTFAGELINIDVEGQRATHNNSEHEDALQLWLLGGSTMWGQGAPDAETIPSYVAQLLNQERGLDVLVRNLGEIGYVSTQEIVALMRQLQLGRRPDYVVFFDGVNDAPAAALWPETLGTHMNYYRIRDRFEAPGRRQHHPIQAAIRGSGMVRFSTYLNEKLGLSANRYRGAWNAPRDAAQARERGETAARLWLDNYRLTEALGRAYGFVPIYVLQPSLLVGAKPLHPSEAALQEKENENEAKRAGMAVYAEMLRSVRELLQHEDPPPAVYDASDLFAAVEEPVYIDYVHMSGRGNRIIAERLVEILEPHLCGDVPPRVSERVRTGLRARCD